MGGEPARPRIPRPRNVSRFLHGSSSTAPLRCNGRVDLLGFPAHARHMSGAALVELLISMSILTIGVLGLLSGSRGTRRQASLAASRAAEALAAQQVLERNDIGISGDSLQVDTIAIGVIQVEVRTVVRDSFPGMVWIDVVAQSESGTTPWRLETARRAGN